MRFTRVLPWILLATLPLLPTHSARELEAADSDGARPRNLAVTPAGDAVLVTSLGSSFITQTHAVKATGPWTPPSHIDVFAKSWGITLIDDNAAVITHPFDTRLSVVRRPASDSLFVFDSSVELGDAFRYSTEIITNPNDSSLVLVANRGMSPTTPGAESWNHAVYEVDVAGGVITRTFITEREPRSLAVSPDGERLFVGHVKGALGRPGLVDNHPLGDNRDSNGNFRDGGSILVYDLTTPSQTVLPEPTMRFGVGSPVRGLATSANDDATYALYYTHAGDNANSENPAETPLFFGGRQIPNVISSIIFTSSHVPVFVENHVFAHDPDLDPENLDPVNPATVHAAVVPDKICVRDYMVLGIRQREVWVSNSGSGTVSRAKVDDLGLFEIEPTPLAVAYVRLARDFSTHDMDLVHVPFIYQVLGKINGGIANHTYVTSPNSTSYTSNPRAIAYDATNDYVWVATHFDNELFALRGGDLSIEHAERMSLSMSPSGDAAERSFFSFGRGFEFREELGDVTVGNLTCATCHVDGHSDGKVRLTMRGLDNRFPGERSVPSGDVRKPVATPSNFDVGQTDWIFFEGLKTIRDGNHGDFIPCLYCGDASFFDSTEDFTNVISSPVSPYCPDGVLDAAQRRGRYLFEAMNCSRCHSGPVAAFDKSNVLKLPAGVDQAGPTPATLGTSNRILHDPTQSYITQRFVRQTTASSSSGSAAIPELPNDIDDFSSARNVTDVGTRVNIFAPTVRDGFWNGINTPALAGAWDNAPFMHDGRYRRLEDVLRHTWVDPADDFRTAPLVLNEQPDNSFNQLPSPKPGDIVQTPRDPDGNGIDDRDNHLPNLFAFGTHAPSQPGRVSIYDYLNGPGAPYAGAYQDLEGFLRALSSETDPCAGPDDFVSTLQVTVNGDVATANWQTVAASPCNILWGHVDSSTTFATTPPATSHSLVMNLTAPGDYRITVIPKVLTICGSNHRAETTFSDAPALRNAMAQNFPNPFNPSTTIEFSIENDGHVNLSIFDSRGRLVRTLVNGMRTANTYSVPWNGIANSGNAAATGIYFYRITTPQFTQTRKLVLLR